MPKPTDSEFPEAARRQHDLRYLFFVTTCVAVGLGLFSQAPFHTGVGTIGLGIVEYWIAKGFFVASTRMPKGLREIVFLIGLPFFIGAMYCVLTGLVYSISDLIRWIINTS